MKKLVKKINIFGLGLVLVGGLVITAQSAFTNAVLSDEYGYDGTNWYRYAEPIPGTESFSTCSQNPEVDCSYIFDTPPTGTTLPSEGTPSGKTGEYNVVILP